MKIAPQPDPIVSTLAASVAGLAYFLLDANGFVVSWNPGAERIKSYTPAEILGRHFSCLYPEDQIDQNEPTKHLAEAVSCGSIAYKGWRKGKDGSLFWGNFVLTALYDEQNNLTGFVNITQDLPEQKQIEAPYAIVELSHDAIITTDSDGIVSSWNRGAQALYGYSAAEMCGRSIQVVFAADEPMPLLKELSESYNFEGKHTNKAGNTLTTSVTVCRMKASSGVATEVSWICRDMTENKRLFEELERSNKDLQQFAYVASHDLQEPVRAVIGCLQLLEDSLEEVLSERSAKYLHEARKGATRMQSLINDLLSYAQVHTKAADLLPTDLSTLLSEAIENLQGPVKVADAKITCEQLPVVAADRSQIRRVFENYIGNAIKYRSSAAPEIHVGVVRNFNEWVFCIGDNGIGFDMQFANRIFDIFQRLHPRSKYEGTGIGLAICRRTIERHGGRVWVESQPGTGSKFYFSLPAQSNGGHNGTTS
jgi:PAS domain S-box-containing protein